MKSLSTARRYARALYELAQESKTADEVLQGMGNVAMAISTIPSFEKILLNPLMKTEEKQDLVKKITSNKLILRFMALLAKRDRLDLLILIYDELRSMADEHLGIHRVFVKTPMVLTDAQKKTVEKEL